jgi:ATP-dependent RNA helicase RhlE
LDHGTFSELGLAPALVAALQSMALTVPTPVQMQAIPIQLAGRDLVAVAPTGSGKTAAYGLPVLHALATSVPRRPAGTCRGLVLAPTRELAAQIAAALAAMAAGTRLRVVAVTGGTPRLLQVRALARGVDIVVATPGRLIDLAAARAIDLGLVRHLVLDEADRLLDLGFLDAVRRIVQALPRRRQTAMFSATMPEGVTALAAQILREPLRIDVAAGAEGAGRSLALRTEIIAAAAKYRRLSALLAAPDMTAAIVFCRTRRGADALGRGLAASGFATGTIHGGRSQAERTRTLDRFRSGRIDVLVATDLVARGIDVPRVSHVISFDLPEDAESHVHRLGRAGRGSMKGTAITLCTPSERPRLRRIERAARLRHRAPRRQDVATG